MHEVSDEWCKCNIYIYIPLSQVHGGKRPSKLNVTQLIVQSKVMGDTISEIPNPRLSKQTRRGQQVQKSLRSMLVTTLGIGKLKVWMKFLIEMLWILGVKIGVWHIPLSKFHHPWDMKTEILRDQKD